MLATSEDAADRKGSQFYERTVQNCGYEAVVSVSAGTGRGYRPAEREYPATITPVVAGKIHEHARIYRLRSVAGSQILNFMS